MVDPIHTLTLKITEIIATEFPLPPEQPHIEYRERTTIMMADRVVIEKTSNGNYLVEAFTNDDAVVCRHMIEGQPFFYDGDHGLGISHVIRCVVENPNGKTSHHISRQTLRRGQGTGPSYTEERPNTVEFKAL